MDADRLSAISWIYMTVLGRLNHTSVFIHVSISGQSTGSWKVHAYILHICLMIAVLSKDIHKFQTHFGTYVKYHF